MKGLRRYNHRLDYELIVGWYEARGLQAPPADFLSGTGYIMDDRVAAWLYKTDSTVAMIEGVISDPKTVPSLRHQSLTKLCAFMVDAATMLGFNHIIGMTKHSSIANICESLGFKRDDMAIYTLSVSDYEDSEEENIMRYNLKD